MTARSHPQCWTGDKYVHTCQDGCGSGLKCLECGEAAGTLWGPYFCPRCDVERLDRIASSLYRLKRSME